MLLILKRVYLYATAASIVDMAARRSTALPAAFGARLQALNEEVIGGLLPEKQVPKPCSYPLKAKPKPEPKLEQDSASRSPGSPDRPSRAYPVWPGELQAAPSAQVDQLQRGEAAREAYARLDRSRPS